MMMETWNVSRSFFYWDELRRRSWAMGRSWQSSSSSRAVQSLSWNPLLDLNCISLGESSNSRKIFSKGKELYRTVKFEMATKRREEPAKQRYQANARERDRTHRWSSFQETKSSLCSVNTAYSALRTLIPTEPADRKLSKIETLRLASSYISHLDAVLIAGPIDQPCLRLEESNVAAYRQNREDYWGETTQHSRPQVCTFCLAMHKKYNFNVASQMISSDCEKVNGSSFLMIPTNGTSYFDVNGI